jgi:hypothetical protein
MAVNRSRGTHWRARFGKVFLLIFARIFHNRVARVTSAIIQRRGFGAFLAEFVMIGPASLARSPAFAVLSPDREFGGAFALLGDSTAFRKDGAQRVARRGNLDPLRDGAKHRREKKMKTGTHFEQFQNTRSVTKL